MSLFGAGRIRLFQALAEGARSGLGADAALRALGPSSGEGADLLARVERGSSFGEALRAAGFPSWQAEVAAAAEAAGRLDEAFAGLAAELERRRAFWLALLPKLLYPLILLHVAPALMIIPSCVAGGTPLLPRLLRFLLPLWLGGAALAWVLAGVPGSVLARLPLISSFIKTRFFSTLALLVRTGLPFPKAVGLSAASAGLPASDAGLRRALDAAAAGSSFADALAALGLLSRAETDALRTSELAGRCDEQLSLLARLSAQRNAALLDAVVAALPPLAYLAVALWVASRIIDSYSTLLKPGGF
ncbi:MAG: type II secretion system F family protein [Elusimicrobiota bacterium]|jgi:general secretion pathway protein F